jgi:iron complex outermembrane recepter protein
MQSAVNQQPKLRLSLIALACHLVCVSAAYAQTTPAAVTPAAAPAKTEVIITGKKLGMGLMVTEDAPKARSTITAEELEKQRPTGNAYQALEMLPSVNSYNQDATGLFGGGLTLRGFNSDQIGATINGVPVNDSGNFAIYPQEYVDQENTCSESVTQGSTDVDSPQVGASGGNFNITTCNPDDKRRVRLVQTVGQLNLSKTFMRYDTGLWGDKRSKLFVSYSHAKADKWKGQGGAERDHIDAGFNYDWDRFNYIHATLLYNEALNNNINNLLMKEIVDPNKGYFYDYADTWGGHATPVKGTAQTDPNSTSSLFPNATSASGSLPAYYKLGTNPFKNAIFSAPSKFRLNDSLDLKVLPYMWYGFGTGGIQSRLQAENGFLDKSTNKVNAGIDLNGDGDTLDKVLVASSSVTKTYRPGMTSSLTYSVGNHEILGGFWYERARHEQTGPAVAVKANGEPVDYYLQHGQILRPDGTPFETRDYRTLSTAWQTFLQDTISVADGKGTVNIGVRLPYITRDFVNYASEGITSAANVSAGTYSIKKTYNEVLPQLGARYRITNDDQLFVSVAKNMKAPPNFVFSNVGSNVKLVNGVATLTGDVTDETSTNTDIGYRHQDNKFIFTFTVFNVNFQNRQATAFDPVTLASTYTNVGKVKNNGFEIEAGNMPVHGWSFYSSLGYQKSEIQNDMLVLDKNKVAAALPTAGKEMPASPKLKAGLSAEYQDGALWGRVTMKATSKQYGTMVNDELAPGYTTFGFDSGYTFANFGLIKRPKLNFNISNLLNKRYYNPSSTTATNAVAYGNITSTNVPRYYLGAPRFASVSLSVDF